MKIASTLLCLILPMVVSSTVLAGPDGLEGNWQGFLNPTPAAEVRLILRVEKGAKGVFQAKAESPEIKTAPALPFDEVTVSGVDVTLVAKASKQEFRGKLNPMGTEIVGEWSKGASKIPLTFERIEGAIPAPDLWEGTLEVPGGVKLRLVFHVYKSKAGVLRASMDSPDQGALGFKVNTVEISKDAVKFAVKSINGSFEGKLDPTGDATTGQWSQGGANFPLTLKKVTKVAEARRPQLPQGPFPYVSEEVAYESRAQGVRIAGTLTRPEGDGPFPAVLLITGSGPQDRDESILGHKPFLVLADDLTRRGIAVLRVDDRGVGTSTGDQATATTADFAEDVLGGVDFLKTRARIDPRRIGLIGHSEGGLIAPIVATRSKDVAFIVLMAGPGLPGDQILIAQLQLILAAAGAPPEKVRESARTQARYIAVAKEPGDSKQTMEKLKAVGDEIARELPEADRKAMAESDPNGSQLGRLATPWFRYFLTYDPRPTLAQVRCPILAINGEKDLQVPPVENLAAIDRAVRDGNPASNLTTRQLPGLNHLFQACSTGAPSEYASIEETINPAALQVIGDWITRQTSGH